MLRRIKVRTIDERGLEEQVRGSLPALFLNRPDEVCDALRSFAEDSIHKYIDREELISYLQSKGFSRCGDLLNQVTRLRLFPKQLIVISKPHEEG